MCEGGGSLPAVASKDLIACREAKTASPMAVRRASTRESTDRIASCRSAVGGETRLATPAKLITPTLNRSGRLRMKFLAEFLAASNLLGSTSVAIIDSDTSIATMIVARSRGTLTAVVGCE